MRPTAVEPPGVVSLWEAVDAVIKNNMRVDRAPMRLVRRTRNLTGDDLVRACSVLTTRHGNPKSLKERVRRCPDLITLEDFVCTRGAEWHFPEGVTNAAIWRVGQLRPR